MGPKRKLLTKNDVKLNFGIPIELHSEFEEIFVIEKRNRGGKLLKKDFIKEVIKKGISQAPGSGG